ncbi:MAG: YwmB family TATA-box binding protein [Lachnospiraceae bacterium]|nr:YwmB family TATA-box binding protein [Lachnospiraceae bacterium]
MNKKVRAAIYVGVILWIVAFFQIVTTKYMVNEAGITQAFARNQMTINRSTVELKANLGTKTLDKEVMTSIFGENTFVTVQNKNGQNFAHVQASENSDLSDISEVYATMQKLCEKSKVTDYELSISVSGAINGEMTKAEKDTLCNSMEKAMGAARVRTIDEDGYYVSYSYTPGLEGNIISGGLRSNLTIALTYDSETNKTKVIMGSPLLSNF